MGGITSHVLLALKNDEGITTMGLPLFVSFSSAWVSVTIRICCIVSI